MTMEKNALLTFLVVLLACTSNNNTMKHPLDKSQVRTLVLKNKLKVYLLSDPNFNFSAASMAVEVGHLDNPDNRLGLAHFLEHMLFLGTEKFPDVDEYKSYLKNNGGYSNAYTTTDLTNYQFQVLPSAFEGALDRFSQFFVSPLFTEEYTSREVNAVNSEFQMYKMNDARRSYRLSQIFAKDGHPEQKFNVGSLETLGDIDRQELFDFYYRHYSSNRMGLAFLSTHSLDQMEEWARKYFSNIENRELKANQYDSNFFEKKQTTRLVYVDPVKDIRDLRLVFALPGTRHLYESKPGRQIGFVLGHEGSGSLLSYLKEQGWAISLGAGAYQNSKNHGSMNITIGLTESGMENYKEVLSATMDYIGLMKKSDHPKHVFQELKAMAELDEIYSNKGEGMNRAVSIANEVLKYPLEDAGRINYIYKDNTSKPYKDLLHYLAPDNLLVMLSANGVVTDQVEHFFGSPYSYNEDDDLYKNLLVIKDRPEFKIPETNPFIPKNASVPNRKLDGTIFPEKMASSKGVSLFFGRDHEFLRPKGVINLKILFPKEKMSVEHRVYSRLFAACVNESLNELSYPAKQAGLNYSIKEGYGGIYVDVNGYKESAMKLYESMLDHMTSFSITANQFEAIKDKVVRDYENFALMDAYNQTRELAPDLFYNVKYTWGECLPIARNASLKRLNKYVTTLFDSTFLEAMVYGDFIMQDSKKVINLFKDKTNTAGISRQSAFDIEYLSISKPETIQYVDKLLVNNSCLFRVYEIGESSPEVRAKTALISKAIEQPFFTEMRTNQQLGYVVGSYPRPYDETHYLNFLIQSGDYPADELNKRADSFISSLPGLIRQLEDKAFNQLVESSIEQLEKKPMSISERAAKYRTLIFEHDSDFERDIKTIEALKRMKKETVADHLGIMINKDTRKMVNILTFAENHENKTGVKNSFGDLSDWKSSRAYE